MDKNEKIAALRWASETASEVAAGYLRHAENYATAGDMETAEDYREDAKPFQDYAATFDALISSENSKDSHPKLGES
jgi:hypothetical protein